MSIDRIISVTTRIAPPPVSLANFGIPMVAAILTGPQGTAWTSAYGADLTVEVTPATWQSTLTALGVTSSEDLFVALTDLFSQELGPDLVLLGRRATPVAQVVEVDISGTDDGSYEITLTGAAFGSETFSFAAVGQTADQIEAALISAVNGGTLPITAAAGTGDQLTLTADEAGVPFVTGVEAPSDNLTATVATASTGIVEDIALWRAERDDFYFLLETTRSSGVIGAAAEIIETLRKLLVAQTDDANAQSGGSDADLASVLGPLGLNLSRTALVWHDNDDQFVDFALVGLQASKQPGSSTYANKPLVSVTGIVPTSDTTLDAKHYTWLESFPAQGAAMTMGGYVCSGLFIDLVILRDWLDNLIQVRFFEALRANEKIGYQSGAPVLRAVLNGALLTAAAPDVDGIEASSIQINVPLASQQSSTDRGNRHYPGITWGATLTGAVHTLDITGNLAP